MAAEVATLRTLAIYDWRGLTFPQHTVMSEYQQFANGGRGCKLWTISNCIVDIRSKKSVLFPLA